MITVLKFWFTIEQLQSVRFRSIFFFAVLTIGEVMFPPLSDLVSLELEHRLHLLRHDRCMVLSPSQVKLLLKLIMRVWLSSCMWYLSCRLSNNIVIGQFNTVFEDWSGCIIWWMVQGKAIIPPSTARQFFPGILQLRLYALCNCSKKLLVFMVALFAAEIGVMMWMLVGRDLLIYSLFLTSSRFHSLTLNSIAGTLSENFSVSGYYHNDVEACYNYPTAAYERIWIPCLAFDVILAVLSLWTVVRHSKSPKLNKPQLAYVVVQGNVIYFLGCAFSRSYWIWIDNRM